MSHDALLSEFCQNAVRKIEQDAAQITRCVALLDTNELWSRANDHCNSVANLLLHLTGNVRQWIVSGVGGEPFERDRPAEFAARDQRPAGEILPPLMNTLRRAGEIIRQLAPDALSHRRSIQGYDVSTMQAVFHVVEHLSFHTGQIVHMTKALKGVDLSLFDAQGRRRAPSSQPW